MSFDVSDESIGTPDTHGSPHGYLAKTLLEGSAPTDLNSPGLARSGSSRRQAVRINKDHFKTNILPQSEAFSSSRCRAQGILFKANITAGVLKRWKSHWVTLADNNLYYSSTETDKDVPTVLSKIYGSSIMSIKQVGKDSYGFVFEIQAVEGVTRWACENEEEYDKWLLSLQQLMVACVGPSSIRSDMNNLFLQCHQSDALFSELVLRSMFLSVPHWRNNKELAKLELLRAIDRAYMMDDDLDLQASEIADMKEGKKEKITLQTLSRNLRNCAIVSDQDVLKNNQDN
ncbi:Cyth2, partial [Acrasis kona]